MASCGRAECMKCSAPPRCPRGWGCPRCRPMPPSEPNKFEQDYNRLKGRKS